MLIALWRWLLLLVAAAAIVFSVADIIEPSNAGDFGLTLAAVHGEPGAFTVKSPSGPAARAGLSAGDTVRLPAAEYVRCARFARAGERCSLDVVRAGGIRTVTLTAQPAPVAEWVRLLQTVLRLSFLTLGGLVAWRWFENPAARALATMLVAFGLAMTFTGVLLRTGWGGTTIPIVNAACFVAGSAAAVYFATLFPTRADDDVRVLLRRLCVPIGVVAIACLPAQSASLTLWAAIVTTAGLIYFAVATVISLGISFARAQPADRPRMLWVLSSFGAGFVGLAVGIAQQLTGQSDWASFGLLAIPFGLTYVIARHRVFGIAFVVNRAVVYAGVSLVVVATFLIAEWLFSQVFVNVSRTTNLALQLGVALVLGLAIRPIHARVDRVVDDVLFRARHLAEAAIRRFAHEANLVTDADDLLDKTVEVLARDADASAVAIYRRGRDGIYEPVRSNFAGAAPVGENDWALLEMRAWHQPLEMHDGRSRLPGDIAFPMTVRGRLAGAVVCALKRSGEAYAPDERDAVRVLAHEVGLALDALEVTHLRRELARIAEEPSSSEDVRERLRKIADE
jgi:GAF domain